MTMPSDWIVPDWPAPAGVRALVTTRSGGVSPPPWGATPQEAGGMNLGLGSGDEGDRVLANRARLRSFLPAEPMWLRQVHGARVMSMPMYLMSSPRRPMRVSRSRPLPCAR
jgi:polyphenol oxidase